MNKKLLCIWLCILIVLTGCDEENMEYGGEQLGVYYEPLDSKMVSQPYNFGLSQYGILNYDNRVYTSVDTFDAFDKNELDLDKLVDKELAIAYSNHSVYWSADKSELAEVTLEGKLYSVKGYDEKYRVCVYYEIDMGDVEENTTYYTMRIFDCLNGIYMDKGRDLFVDIIDLSKATKVECGGISVDIEDEKLQTFLEALYNGTFIEKSDEAYPDLSNECCSTIKFYDEYGFENSITVYEKGYVTKNTNGHETMVIKTDISACKAMVISWSGIYRADKTVDISENEYVNHYIKVDIDRATKDGELMNRIFVYMKKVTTPIDTNEHKKEEVILNNEVEVPVEVSSNIVFSMKESGFLDNAEDIKDVYIELARESGDIIYFRYSDSERDLENEEYYRLERSEY